MFMVQVITLILKCYGDSILMHKILHSKGKPIEIWGDGQLRDFAYTDDVATGIVQAMYYGTKNSFVNLASGKGYTIGTS